MSDDHGPPRSTRHSADGDQFRAAEIIGQIVNATGLSISEIAKSAGVSPSTLTRLYPNASVKYTLSARTIRKLQDAFPLTRRDAVASSRVSSPQFAYRAEPIAMTGGLSIFRLGPVVPHGTATATGIEMFDGDLDEPIGRWSSRQMIEESEHFFIVYMPGDGMVPRIHAGEALLIDSVRPPALHSDILAAVRQADGRQVFVVGTMSGRDRDSVTISQLRDTVSTTFPHEAIIAVYRIAGRFESIAL